VLRWCLTRYTAEKHARLSAVQLEFVCPEPDKHLLDWPSIYVSMTQSVAGLFSIEIMAMCPGGSWKPLSEWEVLFTEAKLKLDSVQGVGYNMHLMCFVKA